MRPRVAVVLSGYGKVARGAEAMLAAILPRLESRFELHVYSRSGRGPNGVRRPAIPRAVVEPFYLATELGRKALDTLFLDPIHVEWASHLILSLPSLMRGRYRVIWHETGLWGGFLLAALRRRTGVKLLDYAHCSHPGWELRFARRRPDLFVTADPGLASRVRREVDGLRVEVVSQGVDCDLFRPGLEPRELAIRRPIVLVVGALSPEKRPDLAIAAVARRGLSAVVVGDGPLARRIDAQAATALGAGRYMRLSADRGEMPHLYAAADVLLLTSPLESGALAALEALACGTPVVTADDSLRRELIGDAGFLVREQTPEAYAAALDRALATDWGDRPRQRAVTFSLDRQAHHFGDLLDELAIGAR